MLLSVGSVQARAMAGVGPSSSFAASLYRALYLDQKEHSKNPPESANFDMMKQQPNRVKYVPLKHSEHITNMRNAHHVEHMQESNTNIEDEVPVWTPWSSRSEGPKFKIPPPADRQPVDEKKGKR